MLPPLRNYLVTSCWTTIKMLRFCTYGRATLSALLFRLSATARLLRLAYLNHRKLEHLDVPTLAQAFDTNRDGHIDAADAMRSRQDLAAREIGKALM